MLRLASFGAGKLVVDQLAKAGAIRKAAAMRRAMATGCDGAKFIS